LQAVAFGPFGGGYDPQNLNDGAKAASAIKTTTNQLDCLKKNAYIN
jgi:hypothetical protein